MERDGAVEQKNAAEFPVIGPQTGGDKAELATHVCEVCGTCFETRRGLSSHARSHLRQMGVCVSESSGAPISLLYELVTEREGSLPFTSKHTNAPKKLTTQPQQGIKYGSGNKLKIKISELVKKQCAPHALINSSSSSSSSSLSTSSSSSSSSPPRVHKPTKDPSTLPALSKPLQASQEKDTQLDLMEMSGVSKRDCIHICQLCGAWYETKKGLASHARAHLRQFGVELDPKASPIQVLHDMLQKEAGTLGLDFEDLISQDTPTALLTPPPVKKRKPSFGREGTPRDGDSIKIASCEFCGENFKKTQSLASHARSHLRQLGVTNWTAHGSPMVALRELMAHRNCSQLPRSTPLTLGKHKARTEALSLSAPGPSPSQLPQSLSEAPPLPAQCSSPSHLTMPQFEAFCSPAPGPSPFRVPKARKGSRMVVPKLKSEPVEFNISIGQPPKSTPPSLPQLKCSTVQSAANHTTVSANQKLTTGLQVVVGVAEPVQCDYCGDLFDSRKALSCHARAHLRQLGVKWEPFASPINTLYELMVREGREQELEDTASPVAFCREKTEVEATGSVCEATCELCGFDFENRKALASHARAHLRQLGEQWSSSQSPIAALSQWMTREPEKVAELHQLYMQGTFPHIRKRRVYSFDAVSARSGVSHASPAVRKGKTGVGLSSSHRKLSSHRPAHHPAVDFGPNLPPLKPFPLRIEGAESLKRVGNIPSLVPRPPETSLVKVVGKIYSLKCRFCEQVFSGPLSVQEDWLIHLRHHILNLKPDSSGSPASILPHSESPQLIGQAV